MFSSDTLLGKISRFPLGFLPPDLVLSVLMGPVRGCKWIVGSGLHSFWLGSFEYEKQKRIARELKPDGTFFDIGANAGFYTLLAARLIAPAKVYAIEPLPRNIKYLRRHLELNHIHNVELMELAISDRVGSVSFQEAENGFMGHMAAQGGLQVRTATLDSLVFEDKISPPHCIKMDIEGAELSALNAAGKTFQQFRPVLFLSTHGREVHTGCRQLLESWGYKCQVLDDAGSPDRSEIIARFAA